MTTRRVIGGVGRTLVVSGVLVLLFVAYQLWGTAIHEARAQDRLEDEFAAAIAAAPVDQAGPTAEAPGTTVADEPSTDVADDAATDASAGATVEARFGPPPAPAEPGDPVARLRIPSIGVDKVVVSGVSTEDLKAGPGHFPGTPLPGQAGNAAIAGHRTTYGAPFFDFDDLEPGDEIFVTTLQGEFTYEVTSSEIVAPSAIEVLAPTDDNRLTFSTCNPKYSAAERLIVVAHLVGEAAPGGPGEIPRSSLGQLPTEEVGGDDEPATTAVEAGDADDPELPAEAGDQAPDEVQAAGLAGIDLGGDLDGASSSRFPVVMWGLITALIWLGGWFLGRAWRKWPAYAVVAPVFLVSLFVFYENVSRLLPANV